MREFLVPVGVSGRDRCEDSKFQMIQSNDFLESYPVPDIFSFSEQVSGLAASCSAMALIDT